MIHYSRDSYDSKPFLLCVFLLICFMGVQIVYFVLLDSESI